MTDAKAIAEYKKRRITRLRTRFDADGDESENNSPPAARGGGHGNTKIPFGLCQREGIKVGADWTPKDAWEALEGKGYSASDTYKELKKTGKTPKSPTGKTGGATADVETARKDFSSKRAQMGQLRSELNNHPQREELERRITFCKNQLEDCEMKANICLKRTQAHEKKFGMTKEEIEEAAWQGKFLHWEERGRRMARPAKDFVRDYRNLEFWERGVEARKKELEEAEKKRSEVLGPIEEKIEKARKEVHEAAKRAFPSLDDCKNVEELESRFNAEGLFKGEADSNFGELGLEHSRRVIDATMKFFEKHADLKGKLNAIRVDFHDDNQMGYSNDHEVFFNSKYFGDEDFENIYKRTVDNGFHPEGTTAMSVIAHEYTHQLDNYMTEMLGIKRGKFSDKVLREVQKEIRTLTEDEIKKSVSDYSMKKYKGGESMEFLAEAYSEYLTSPNPRRIAMATGKIVEKYLKKVHKSTEVKK